MRRLAVKQASLLAVLVSLLVQAYQPGLAAAPGGATSSAPTLRFVSDPQSPSNGTVELTGLDPNRLDSFLSKGGTEEAWASLLSVYTVPDAVPAAVPVLPPVSGSYAAEGSAVRFTPRYPFGEGLTYRVQADLRALGEPTDGSSRGDLHLRFSLPKRVHPPTTVAAVYPSGDLLPENLLRFYLHLSAPMRRGEAYDHVKLVGPDGKEVEGAFLNIAQEFWDPSMKRLTLMLDPGRIKRGAAPNLEAGVALQADETFRLVVDPAWRDAAGNPLAQPYEKRFRVGAADRESPDPRSWLIRPPAAGTTAPLVVDFPKPLDHALLGSLLGVRTSEGERVDGEVEVLAGETRWRFTPARVWASTSYALVASPTLEDVAGNNLDIPFDRDLHRAPRSSHTRGVVSLPFETTSNPRSSWL